MNTQANQTLLVRRPIYNRKLQVFAYQLHFDNRLATEHRNHDQQAARMIVNAVTFAQEYELCDGLPMFISTSYSLLLSGSLLCLPPDQIVLDIINPVVIDEAGLDIVQKYRKKLFRLAITVTTATVSDHPLLAWADYIRIPIGTLNLDDLNELFHQINRQNNHAKPLLCEIESQEQLQLCQALQANLFQGHFIYKSELVKGNRLSTAQNACIALIIELQSPNITIAHINELLLRSPELNYRLQRIIHSTTDELTQTIESLQAAANYWGLHVICHWVSLMLLADASNKPKVLVINTLIRAKMCESLCLKLQAKDAPRAFLVGMFSTIDAMLDVPLALALTRLP